MSNCIKLKQLILGDITYNIIVADGDTLIIDNKRDMGDITLYKCRSIKQILNGNISSYPCNLASRSGYFAHGETAKEAIRDVNIKISTDALKLKPLELNEFITPERYREITGACELGVKRFTEEHNLNGGIYLHELIPILEASNSYGVDKILKLIKNN